MSPGPGLLYGSGMDLLTDCLLLIFAFGGASLLVLGMRGAILGKPFHVPRNPQPNARSARRLYLFWAIMGALIMWVGMSLLDSGCHLR